MVVDYQKLLLKPR